MTNSEIEDLWIEAWSKLIEIVEDEARTMRCLLPDGNVVDVERCKGWLQDSVYAGFSVDIERGWVLGHRGVIASRLIRD